MNIILIAEDNPLNLKVLRVLLKITGVEADAVGNGLEAVEAASRQRYAIILMDIMMPEMDGLEATKAIRKCELTSGHHAAIIAVTAADISRQECLIAGMDDFIAKPIDGNLLRERISYWVNRQAEIASCVDGKTSFIPVRQVNESPGGQSLMGI